ncbi:amidase [uncultured Paraglaciecola sp.]|uniref:amidase n=1 Tax=uncultured Paraglaciecola sp. TaxID=1765024 RepID=UPI0030D981AB|tara:strand:- start:99290 stop:100822 length:1533 start_codon:yes stop_codon:yes gene_type:complete
MRCFLPLLLVITTLLVAAPTYAADKANFSNLTLAKAQELLKSGDTRLTDLVDYYLSRIDKYDANGNKINSVAELNPALKQQIALIQTKLDDKKPLGTLFGAIVLLKDNIDAKGMVNSAGSWLMREHKPKQDAFVVSRLIAEDALILGKANLSEWANFRSSKSSSGWSSLYGQTLNPHDPTRSPCGSSAGSGAAIAADFALLAVGTETDGSVTCPAAVNGIVGIKPTLGLLSRSGIIPIAHSQDTAGPMTRTVTDAVIMLEAMMGEDPMDDAALAPISLSQHLKLGGLKGKRIGVMRNMMGYHPELDQVFNQQLAVFEKAGAIIVDNADIETKGKWGDAEYTVLLAEFKADLNQYLTQSKAPLKSLEDAIAKNIEFSPRTMPVFAQEIFIAAQAAPNLNEKAYLDALANSKLLTGVQGIDATLAKHNVDFLIAPTTAPGWKIDHINGDNYMGSAGSASAVSGYPHITVPMGKVQHMPVNISFVGAKLSEVVLVQAAYEFEQLTQARVSPKL